MYEHPPRACVHGRRRPYVRAPQLDAGRADLAQALRRIVDHGWPLDGASDDGVSEALYLPDADGNGIEQP